MMNKILTIMFCLYISILSFSQNNQFRIDKLNKEIDSLNIKIKELEYKTTYFSSTIDTTNSVHSDILSSYISWISIIFGLLGLTSFGGIFLEIRSNRDKMKSESIELKSEFEKLTSDTILKTSESTELALTMMSDKYREIEKKQEDIFKRLDFDRGQLYFTYAKTINESERKISFIVSSLKYYILSKDLKISLDVSNYLKNIFQRIEKDNRKIKSDDFESISNSLCEIHNIIKTYEQDSNIEVISKITDEILFSLSKIKG